MLDLVVLGLPLRTLFSLFHILLLWNSSLPSLKPRLLRSFRTLQANAIGGARAKTVREYLEKHYSEEKVTADDDAIKLAVTALLEVRAFSEVCRLFIVLD